MGFGNGAFQAARIAIDGVTIIENIETGKIQAPGTTIPSATNSYLSIPITNNQNVATPAPFQQMVQLNLSQYPQLKGVASDLSNVYFSSDEAGQNKLYSWRETPASLTSTQIWWVLLPNGIPANGTVIIYLQVSSSTELDGIYTGEAPQLSSTYGQYDNGASVFNFYDNFAGTSLNTNLWVNNIANSGGTLIINNGMSYIRGSSGNNHPFIYSTSTPSAGVFETYGNIPAGGGGANYNVSGFGLSSNDMGYLAAVGSEGTSYGIMTNDGGLGIVMATGLLGGIYIWQVWIPSFPPSIIYGSQNYGNKIGNDVNLPYDTQPIAFIDQENTGINLGPFYWVRARAYPPNGVMPVLNSLTVKVVQYIISSTSNTWIAPQTYTAPQNINVGQTELTGTTAGSIVYSMPYQGTSYKKFIAYASGYENDTTTAQTISFPVAFTNAPIIVVNSTGLTLSADTKTLTISAPNSTTTYTGWIIIEGY